MTATLHIVIPMAGNGSRFRDAGYERPKPFIEVNGMPMIGRVLENVRVAGAKIWLIAREEDLVREADAAADLRARYGVEFILLDKVTEGAACTILFARAHIHNDVPLLLANSDQLVDIPMQDFVDDMHRRKLDGSIMTFHEPGLHPKWSYARTGTDGLVEEVREKNAISHDATVGIYLFSKGRYFVEAAVDMIIRNDRTKGEFYTCPVYNYMVAAGRRVGIYPVAEQDMHGLGTPEDLERFLHGR